MLSPLVVGLHASGCISGGAHHHFPIGASCNRKPFPSRFAPSGVDHEREIDDVTPPVRVVCASIGVREKLLCNTRWLVQARHFCAAKMLHADRNPAFEDDLEFDRLSAYLECRADAIPVCPNLSQKVYRCSRDPAQGPLRYLAAKRAVAILVRTKEVNILGLTVLAELEHDSRPYCETTGRRIEELAAEQSEDAGYATVTSAGESKLTR